MSFDTTTLRRKQAIHDIANEIGHLGFLISCVDGNVHGSDSFRFKDAYNSLYKAAKLLLDGLANFAGCPLDCSDYDDLDELVGATKPILGRGKAAEKFKPGDVVYNDFADQAGPFLAGFDELVIYEGADGHAHVCDLEDTEPSTEPDPVKPRKRPNVKVKLLK